MTFLERSRLDHHEFPRVPSRYLAKDSFVPYCMTDVLVFTSLCITYCDYFGGRSIEINSATLPYPDSHLLCDSHLSFATAPEVRAQHLQYKAKGSFLENKAQVAPHRATFLCHVWYGNLSLSLMDIHKTQTRNSKALSSSLYLSSRTLTHTFLCTSKFQFVSACLLTSIIKILYPLYH